MITDIAWMDDSKPRRMPHHAVHLL